MQQGGYGLHSHGICRYGLCGYADTDTAYVAMACIVMAYVVMACAVMSHVAMAYVVMASKAMAHIVKPCIVTTERSDARGSFRSCSRAARALWQPAPRLLPL